jgi:hypothetical protein
MGAAVPRFHGGRTLGPLVLTFRLRQEVTDLIVLLCVHLVRSMFRMIVLSLRHGIALLVLICPSLMAKILNSGKFVVKTISSYMILRLISG